MCVCCHTLSLAQVAEMLGLKPSLALKSLQLNTTAATITNYIVNYLFRMLQQEFEQRLATRLANRPYPAVRLIIAYSGGLDSTVLLSLAQLYAKKNGIAIKAIYVNHGLSQNAGGWQRHCQGVCQAMEVEFEALAIQVKKNGDGLEAAAREARYQALAGVTKEQDLILLGQHADDQAETFFLQLMRGAGPAGLQAMPESKQDQWQRQYFRPLLTFTRKDLESYAVAQNLAWIEDESNLDQQFERNFLRHEVMPILAGRWPAFQKSIARSIKHLQAQTRILDDLLKPKLNSLRTSDASLDLAGLALEPVELQQLLLKAWLQALAVRQPSEAVLGQIIKQFVAGSSNADPRVVLDGKLLARYDGKLYVLDADIDDPLASQSWNTNTVLELAGGLGRLTFAGTGEQVLQVVYRGFSKRFKPPGQPSKPLSQWFKAWRVPTWQRKRIPIVMLGDEILSVGNLPNTRLACASGMKIRWQHRLKFRQAPYINHDSNGEPH